VKSFELKKRIQFDDKKVIKDVCSMHTESGINIDRMRLMMKILDKVETANGSVSLEDTEHAALLDQFNGFPFAVAHKDLIDLHDAIKGAKESS
jgi:hypothetical protein